MNVLNALTIRFIPNTLIYLKEISTALSLTKFSWVMNIDRTAYLYPVKNQLN